MANFEVHLTPYGDETEPKVSVAATYFLTEPSGDLTFYGNPANSTVRSTVAAFARGEWRYVKELKDG